MPQIQQKQPKFNYVQESLSRLAKMLRDMIEGFYDLAVILHHAPDYHKTPGYEHYFVIQDHNKS